MEYIQARVREMMKEMLVYEGSRDLKKPQALDANAIRQLDKHVYPHKPRMEEGKFLYHPTVRSPWNKSAARRFVKAFRTYHQSIGEARYNWASREEIEGAFFTYLRTIIKKSNTGAFSEERLASVQNRQTQASRLVTVSGRRLY